MQLTVGEMSGLALLTGGVIRYRGLARVADSTTQHRRSATATLLQQLAAHRVSGELRGRSAQPEDDLPVVRGQADR